MVLTERHRRERRIWAQKNINRQWRTVVFNDESRLKLSNADGRVRVYWRRNERFASNCVLQHNRYGGGGVMVWATINQHFKTVLVVIQGNLTARQYINQVLRPHVRPLFRQRNGLTFQQDDARPHVARLTMDFFRANNIDVLPWPGNSPGCDPIERMWDILGRHLRQRQQQPQTVQQLAAALREEWVRIPRYLLHNICGSVRRILQTVIKSAK